MARERTGNYGPFYGSLFDESEYLPQDQREVNARYIKTALWDYGWSESAIAAIIGNMDAESTLNPGSWQGNVVNATEYGYGLIQWTPAKRYISWAEERDFDPSHIDCNLARIFFELENNWSYDATEDYPLTYKEFIKSNQRPDYLAAAFVKNRLRPSDQSQAVLDSRGFYANHWYWFLFNKEPMDPPSINPNPNPGTGGGGGGGGGDDGGDDPWFPDWGGDPIKKKKKFNFLLFTAQRRRNKWIKKRY